MGHRERQAVPEEQQHGGGDEERGPEPAPDVLPERDVGQQDHQEDGREGVEQRHRRAVGAGALQQVVDAPLDARPALGQLAQPQAADVVERPLHRRGERDQHEAEHRPAELEPAYAFQT